MRTGGWLPCCTAICEYSTVPIADILWNKPLSKRWVRWHGPGAVVRTGRRGGLRVPHMIYALCHVWLLCFSHGDDGAVRGHHSAEQREEGEGKHRCAWSGWSLGRAGGVERLPEEFTSRAVR